MRSSGKLSLYRILTLSLLTVWVLAMALLVRKEAVRVLSVSGSQEVLAKDEDFREEWLGLYYQKNKIGYTTTSYSRDNGGYHIVQKSYLKLQLMGKGEEATVLTEGRLAGDYTVRSFSFNLQSRSGGLKVTGEAVPGGVDLYVHSGEAVIPQRIPLKDPPRLNLGMERYLVGKGLEPGKKYVLSFFDPTMRSNVELKVEVEGKEDIVSHGKTWHTLRLKESFQGMEARSWVTEEGETVKEESPIGYTSLRESREEALTNGWPKGEGVDIIASSAVPSERVLEDPPRLASLTVRIKALHPSGEEILKEFGEGKMMTMKKEDIKSLASFKLPYKGKENSLYLAPDTFVQSDDPKIKEKAREIVGPERDAVEAARKLLFWVNGNLDQVPTFGLPSARDILANPAGDCKVHTILFSALARSVGIPTKLAAGVVYKEGFFYYHAWPEIYIGKWVPVDPTFGQFPADVTHLKLNEGRIENWINIMGLIGNLKIEILKTD